MNVIGSPSATRRSPEKSILLRIVALTPMSGAKPRAVRASAAAPSRKTPLVGRVVPNAPQTEIVTEFHSGSKHQPAITYFENELGGKVAVMAVNLAGCKSANVFNFKKRDLLADIFRRLGGDHAVPTRVVDRANVTLLANENDERMFLHATNLSCDPADSFVFEVVAPYAGGSVEILDGAKWVAADAKWEGGRVTVRPPSPVKVYGTLVLRIRNQSGDNNS